MTPQQRYKQAHHDYMMRTARDFYELSGGWKYKLTMPKIKTANGIESYIIDFMKWNGHLAEKTKVMGVPVIKYAPRVGLDGKLYQVENGIEWRKSGSGTGTSDLKLKFSFPHLFEFLIEVAAEIKVGRDTMKKAQILYKKNVESIKGIYVVFRTVDDFLLFYDYFTDKYKPAT